MSMSTALPRITEEKRARYSRFVQKFRSNNKAIIGFTLVLLLLFVALFAPVLAPYPIEQTSVTDRTQAPSLSHPFGTDDLGRDVFSRVVMGTRISLYVGFSAVAIAMLAGTPIGIIGGYYKGLIDEGLMRTMDAFMSFPPVLLALVIMASIGPALSNAVLAIALVYTPYFARVARSAAISVSNEPFVEAAQARGENDPYIIFREILPNCLAPVLVQASINIAFAMLVEASLSFLGLGAQPPTPSWGLMINGARGYMQQAPWMILFPGLGIAFAVIGFNMLGDGLRDVLDPKVDMVEN